MNGGGGGGGRRRRRYRRRRRRRCHKIPTGHDGGIGDGRGGGGGRGGFHGGAFHIRRARVDGTVDLSREARTGRTLAEGGWSMKKKTSLTWLTE